MEKAVIQSLHGLVPSVSDPLPRELVDLATSLLAQSRNRASNLRAEEETARAYVCAHIACESLKKSLSLPKIEARPPCPPRIYKKLHEHMNSVLSVRQKVSNQGERESTASKRPNVPTLRKADAQKTATPSRSTASRSVPSRTRSQNEAADGEPPSWAMPMIRQLCRRLSAPKAAPHVFTGLSTILAAIDDEASSQVSRSDINVASLLTSITFFVCSRLFNAQTGHGKLVDNCKHAISVFDEGRHSNPDIPETSEADIRTHMRMIAVQKWISMEWFRNIQIGSGLDENDDIDEDLELQSSNAEMDIDVQPVAPAKRTIRVFEPKGEYLRPGLGTMMNPKVDFLGDESVVPYEAWRENILVECEEMREAESSRMQTEAG